MTREVGQRVKGLENEQGLLWGEVRALRDRITHGWEATLKVILRPPGNVSIADGRHVAPETSGQANLGTESLPFGVVYANSFTNPSGEVVATEITDQDGGANIKAARSATASMLLALDGSARFPASTITLAGTSGLSLSGGLQLADGVAGAGLTVSSKVLAVGAGNGINVLSNSIAVLLSYPAGLEFIGGGLRIADSIAGDGLSIASKVLAVDSSVVRTTRQVIAGSGLTGGGALSANVTLNVGAGDGIDVAADAIAVDVTDFIDTAYGLTEGANNIRINAGTGLGFSSGALVHASGDLGDLHTNYLLASGTRAMAGNLNMGGHSITSVANVDGVDVSAHASRHERAGADQIDGDHLDIDWNPTNYTPSTSPAEASSVDHLTAHLAGIDDKLVGSELKQYVFTFDGMMSVGGTSWVETAGDFYYDTSKYPTGNATWRATLKIRTSGPTAYVRLYDVTSSTTVATLSTTQTIYQHLSTSVSLTNGHYYRIRMREGTGGNYADALGSYLEW